MKQHRLNDIILPDYSLRYHKSGVTASLFVEWPSTSKVPSLLTGDSKGSLVLWDMITRRPVVTYSVNGGAQIVSVQDLGDSKIAVLSKDHKLRFLEITAGEPESLVLRKVHISGLSFRQVYEIPVNTLNFANFVLQKLNRSTYRLICINTQNSEAIDIYDFELSDMHSLRRIFKGVSFAGVIQKLSTDPESGKAKKLGIVMRFVEHKGSIYCGFESGFVVGFEIQDRHRTGTSTASQQPLIHVIYVSSVHYPEPVLDLKEDKNSDTILSSSTKDFIGIHPILSAEKGEVTVQNMLVCDKCSSVLIRRDLKISCSNSKRIPASSIGHLAVIDGVVIVSTWTGVTIALDPDNQEVARMLKSKSNVPISESSQGRLQGGSEEKADKRYTKVSSLSGISSVVLQNALSSHQQSISRPGQSRRMKDFSEKSWCVIGYDDGSIAVHQIQGYRE